MTAQRQRSKERRRKEKHKNRKTEEEKYIIIINKKKKKKKERRGKREWKRKNQAQKKNGGQSRPSRGPSCQRGAQEQVFRSSKSRKRPTRLKFQRLGKGQSYLLCFSRRSRAASKPSDPTGEQSIMFYLFW